MKTLKLSNKMNIKIFAILFLIINVKLASQVQQPYYYENYSKNLKSTVRLTSFSKNNNTGLETNNNNLLDATGDTRNYSIANGQTTNIPLFSLNFEDYISNPQCYVKEIKSYEVISKVKIGEFEYEKGKEQNPNLKYDIEFEITLDGYLNNVLVPNSFSSFTLKLNSTNNNFIVENQKNITQKLVDKNINRITVGKIKILRFYGNTNIVQDIFFDFELKLEELYKPDLEIFDLFTEFPKNIINSNISYIDEVVNNEDLNSLDNVFVWNNYSLNPPTNGTYTINQCDIEPTLFEVQILRLYNQKVSYSFDSLNCYSIVDWNKATTIFVPPLKNLDGKYFLKDYIPTEGNGYYIYRVRSIYNYYSGGANNSLNWGNWNQSISFDNSSGEINLLSNCFYKNGDIIDINYNGNIDNIVNSSNIKLNHAAIYIKINDYSNWQHQRIFTDSDDKLTQYHETMTYYDDNLKPNQTLNRDLNNRLVIGSQSIYDESGRNVINTLPIPIIKNEYSNDFANNLLNDPDDNTSIKYRKGLALTNTSIPYQYFKPINNVPLSTDPFLINLNQGRTHDYYDGNNNYQYINNSLISSNYPIPSAEQKAYQHNIYSEDGLNRLEYSSQPGYNFSLSSPNNSQERHALEYFYSKATEDELVELFGNTALKNELISKEIIVDAASNKVSVTYKDFQDKIIATAIKTPDGYNPSVVNEYGVSFGSSFEINEIYDKQINTNLDFIINDKINLPVTSAVNLTYNAEIKGLNLNICKNISDYFVSNNNTPSGISHSFNNKILSSTDNFNLHGFNTLYNTSIIHNRINNSSYLQPPLSIFNHPILPTSNINNVDNLVSSTTTPLNLNGSNRLFSKISIEDKSQFQNIFNQIDNYYDYFYFGHGISGGPKYRINNVLNIIQEFKQNIKEKDVINNFDHFLNILTTNNNYKYYNESNQNYESLWVKYTVGDKEYLKSNLVHNNANTCIEPVEIEIPKCTICDLSKYEVNITPISDYKGSKVTYGTKHYDFAKILLDKLIEKYKTYVIHGTHYDNAIFLINSSDVHKIKTSIFLNKYNNGYNKDYNNNNFNLNDILKRHSLDKINSITSDVSQIKRREKLLGLFFFQNYFPLNLIEYNDVDGENMVNLNYNTSEGFNKLITNILTDYTANKSVEEKKLIEDKICYTLDKFIETVVETAVTTQNINDSQTTETDFKEDLFSSSSNVPPTYYLNKQVNTLDILFDVLGRNLTGFRNSNSLIESPNENFITHAHKYFKKWNIISEKLLNNKKPIKLKQTLPLHTNETTNNKIIGGNASTPDALRVFTLDDFYFPEQNNLSNCDDEVQIDKKWESYYKEYTSSLYSEEQMLAIDKFMSPDNQNKGNEIIKNNPSLNDLVNNLGTVIDLKKYKNNANELRKLLNSNAKIINSTCDNKREYFSMVLRKYLEDNEYYVENNKLPETEYNISNDHFKRLLDILVSDCHRYTDVIVNEAFVDYISKEGANPNNLEPFVFFHLSSNLNAKRLAYRLALIKNKPLIINGIELGVKLNSQLNKQLNLGGNNNESDNCKYIGKYITAFNDISNYKNELTDIVDYINESVNEFYSSLNTQDKLRHKYNDRLAYMNEVKTALEFKLSQQNTFKNIMYNRLVPNWIDLNSKTYYLGNNNFATHLADIINEEKWAVINDRKIDIFNNKTSKIKIKLNETLYEEITDFTDEKYLYNFDLFQTNYSDKKLYFKQAFNSFILSKANVITNYSRYDKAKNNDNKVLLDFNYLNNPKITTRYEEFKYRYNINSQNPISFSDKTFIYLPSNLHKFSNSISTLHEYAGSTLPVIKISLNLSQKFSKFWKSYRGLPVQSSWKLFGQNVEDVCVVDIALLTLNNLYSACLMERGGTHINFNGANLSDYNSETTECSVSYEFENVDSKFDYEAEKDILCQIDFLEKLETKIIHNILKSKEDQKAIVKETIDEYYKELPKKVTQEIKANYKQDLTYFTLYFYDRAGNLIRTVPPKGVKLASQVCTPPCTTNEQKRNVTIPYTHDTKYAYNASGQLIKSQSADETYPNRFWYNKKGQLRYSQTAKQFEERKISYNLYDKFARLYENGEIEFKVNNTPISEANLRNTINNMILDKTNVSNPINRIDINFPANTTHLSSIGGVYSFRMLTNYSDMTEIPGYPGIKPILPERQNLRNRVNYVTRDEDGDITTKGDQVNTYYSYDLHGNVEYVVQDLPVSESGNNRLFGTTEYNYDLLTKKVLGVRYNFNESDSYVQNYEYDANNRLIKVNSSRYGELEDSEAKYKYYPHGPLKRIEIGEDKLQGIDYTYTINGWLKGINHTDLSLSNDPGRDGNGLTRFGKDAFSSILNYFKNDFKLENDTYSSVNPFNNFNHSYPNFNIFSEPGTPEYFDGNISIWQTKSMGFDGTNFDYNNFDQGFKYDHINRLKNSGLLHSQGQDKVGFKTSYNYDPNGNIMNLNREDGNGILFDNLNYQYNGGATNNKLSSIDDNVNLSSYESDLEDQSTNNYLYDASCNLTKDISEKIQNIKWTPDGKIKQIHLNSSTPQINRTMIDYTYDAMGQRVVKKVTTHYNPGGSENSKSVKKTIYARDANGQVMAIYNTAFSELFNTTKNDEFIRKLCFWVTFELSAGVTKTIKLCEGESFQFADLTETLVSLPQPLVVSFNNSPAQGGGVTNVTLLPNTMIPLDFDPLNYLKIGGDKSMWGWYWNTKTGKYEKRTINKINIFVDNKTKNVVGQNSNGTPAQVKIIQVTAEYNYDNVLTAVGENNIPELAEWHVYGNEQQGRFLTKYPEELSPTYYGKGITEDIRNGIFSRQLGKKAYELKDHLGNVRVTFSDIKMPTGIANPQFEVDLLSKNEYFPYGMKINDLSFNAQNIAQPRYGYNGKEQDNEVKGENNSLDFGARIYDPRGAIFLSQDPLKGQFAFQSPFIFAGNKPINSIDKDGEKEHIMIFHQVFKQGNTFVTQPDDKMTYSNNGKARTWSDNKMGSAVNDNHYIYENKMYNKKTDLPGKAGEFFKREKENTDNLVKSAVLGLPLAAVTAPVMSGAVATWSVLSAGYEMYASIKNNNDNSTQKQDYLSPSLAGYLGKGYVEAINLKYGSNINPQFGELLGNGLDLVNSVKTLNTNIRSVSNYKNFVQLPNDINSTINSGVNTLESTPQVIPNSDEGE